VRVLDRFEGFGRRLGFEDFPEKFPEFTNVFVDFPGV